MSSIDIIISPCFFCTVALSMIPFFTGSMRACTQCANESALGCHSEVIFVIGVAVAQGGLSWHLLDLQFADTRHRGDQFKRRNQMLNVGHDLR